MYHQYFGLSEPAFAIAVNPKFLYMSRQHKEAIAHLLYGIQGGGFVLLSGEVGTGKTTIIRQVLKQLPDNTETAFILNPMAETHSLLATICEELQISGLKAKSSIKQMMDAMQKHLLDNFTNGKRTVLIIDEAQLLSAEVLEQIRLLTNLETDTEKLLQIILVGQPEINGLLSQPRLRQLSQRITARFHLTPLDAKETGKYIEHRLKVAGLKEGRNIFPKNIIKRVHQFSGGVPRLINILCERMLIGAYGHNCYQINNKIYKLALDEIKGVKTENSKPTFLYYIFGTLCALCLLGILGFFTVSGFSEKVEPYTKPSSTLSSESKEKHEAPSIVNQDPSQLKNVTNTTIDPPTTLPEQGKNSPWFSSKSKAVQELFRYYNVDIEDESYPCWQTEMHQLSCSRASLQTWQDFEQLNRPSILSLVTEDKNLAYALVVGTSDTEIFLVNAEGYIEIQTKESVGKMWNGDLIYLWRKPEGFSTALSEGMSSPVIGWIAGQFAILDGQERPITQQTFTLRLKTRVQIFQSNNGLENDGLVGERTIMKLNEKVGLSPELIHSLPQSKQEP